MRNIEKFFDSAAKLMAANKVTKRTLLKGVAAGVVSSFLSRVAARAQELPSENPLVPTGEPKLVRMGYGNDQQHFLLRTDNFVESQCAQVTPVVDTVSGATYDWFEPASEERCLQGPISRMDIIPLNDDGYPSKSPLITENKIGNPYLNELNRDNDEQKYLDDRGYMDDGECIQVAEVVDTVSRARDGLYNTIYHHVFRGFPQEACEIKLPTPETNMICYHEDVPRGNCVRMNGQSSTAIDGRIKLPNGKEVQTHDTGTNSGKTRHLILTVFDEIDVLPEGEMIEYCPTEGDANVYCSPYDFDLCNNAHQYLEAWERDGFTPMVKKLRRLTSGDYVLEDVDVTPFRNADYCNTYQV